MMNLKSLCAIVLASLSILAVGCGSGGGSGSYTPQSYGSTSASSPHFNIQTTNTSTSGGSSEVWGGVTITGYAHPFTIPCDVTSDSNCIPNVGDVIDVGNGNGALNQNKINAFATDGTYGQANFYTDAQPAIWTFYANGPNNSNCVSTSASFITLENSGDGSTVQLRCGSNAAYMVATPSGCVINVNTGVNTCPAYVTLTYPPPVDSSESLPVATALTAANYSTAGANLAQSSVTASTTTSIVVPAPTTYGTTYLVVQDSSGNVIGASEFTIYFTPLKVNRCGSPGYPPCGPLSD